ncbi:hypothetical protein Tco_1070064 [Tanacetum coccineum]|uniref:Transposase-associated domain-containing protein n=1 Tax=Tanacetum coccineum TaxID=301880 RepID=A0ABQ5HM79_9ASTR
MERGTTEGVGLRVVNSHTGNHREDDFMPLETIRRFLGVIGSRSLSRSKGRPSSRIGGLNPFGCAKLTTFAVMCKAYGGDPKVEWFRVFFNLYPGGQWLTFAKRPEKCPQCLTQNHNSKKVDSSMCKTPLNLVNVRTFLDHILLLAGLKPSWEHEAFRNFMYAEDNEDLSFLLREPSYGFGTGPPSTSNNNEPPLLEAEPLDITNLKQLIENTANSGGSLAREEMPVIGTSSVAGRMKDRKCRTKGSIKPSVKRKLLHADSSSRSTRQKTSPAKVESSAFLTIFNDEEGLPDVSKLPNATACHLMISNITPPAWRGHLDNQLDDKDYEELKAKCQAAKADFDNNLAVNLLRQKIKSMSGEVKERKARKKGCYWRAKNGMAIRRTLRTWSRRAEVVPYIDMELVMAAPTILVSADSFEGSFRDTIDIDVDVIHPVPVAPVVFPAATVVMTLAQHGEAIRGIQEHLLEVPIQEELRALRDRVDVAEAESASLRATIRTMGAVETVLHNRMRDERQTHIEIERQLASVQEFHRQDREDFNKIQGVHDQSVRISLIDMLLHDLCIN